MKPSQVVLKLRRIAAAIENSKKPDKLLVAKDLKKLMAAINPPDLPSWDEVENSLSNAFDNLDWEAVAQQEKGSLLLTSEPAYTIYKTHSVAIQAHNIGGKYSVSVSEPGDFEQVYSATPDTFNADAAAKEVVEVLRNILESGE